MSTHNGNSQGLALTTTGPWQGRLLAEAQSFLSWAFIWLWGSVTTTGRLAAAHPAPTCPAPGCCEAELLPVLGTLLSLFLMVDYGLGQG